MLAAHMHEAPVHVAELRPDVPPALGELVMRCLAKDPDARIQSASDVLHTLDTMTSAGTHAPMPSILMGGPGMLRKALLLYVGAFVVVAIVARAAIVAIGLPDWVFPGALIVMALGLPVILFTAYVNHVTRQIALTTAPTITPGGTPSTTHGTLAQLAVKASPHVSWRRAALGGAYALGFLALLVVAYMSMRALGVGPIGSLLAKGTLQKNERILVADFRNTGPDTLLGTIVTEAFRTGLGQSQSIVVMPATAVRDVLRRMQRSSGAHVDFNLAREVATREGMKAFVDGEVLSVGGKYLISARLIETMTGNPLVALQESADSDREILTAIDRLTKRLRERVGESLRSVREARPLEQVTTPSLEALRKYVQGSRALSFEGDYNKGVALLEEAIALDGAFAMAYRRLSVELSNRGGQPVRTMELIKKAYDHRDRLSDAERYLTVGTYYMFGPQQDAGRAISAYESLIDLQPDNVTALNNVAVVYQMTRDFQRAQTVVKHAASLFDAPAVVFANLGSVGIALGDTAQAFRAIRAAETRFPSNAFTTIRRAQYLHALGMTDSAVTLALSVRRTQASEATGVANATMLLAEISQLRGRLADAKRWLGEHREAQLRRGGTAAILEHGIALARIDVSLANSPAAQRGLDRAMESQPIASVPHVARPYPQLVALLTTLGRTDGAKALVALFDKERAFVSRIEDDQVRYQMLGDIAMAERRYLEAIQEYRQADRGICIVCALPRLARAYDRAGNADSAIAVYTRYLETPDPFRFATPRSPGADAEYLAPSYLRLGELWEQKRDVLKAHNYYLKFVDLWKNADPELQPRVAEVRRRIARLKDIEGK
jgi:tetratricopeptide (TPR) repeat protein